MPRPIFLLLLCAAAASGQKPSPGELIERMRKLPLRALVIEREAKQAAEPATCSVPLIGVQPPGKTIPMPNLAPPATPYIPQVRLPAPPCESGLPARKSPTVIWPSKP